MCGKFMKDNFSTIWFCVCSMSLWTSGTWTLQNLAFAANIFRFRLRFRRRRFLRFHLLSTKAKVHFSIPNLFNRLLNSKIKNTTRAYLRCRWRFIHDLSLFLLPERSHRRNSLFHKGKQKSASTNRNWNESNIKGDSIVEQTMQRFLSSFKRNNRSTSISKFFWISPRSSISFIFASSIVSFSFSIFSVLSLSAFILSSFFLTALSSSASDVSGGAAAGIETAAIGLFSLSISEISKYGRSGLGLAEGWTGSAGEFLSWSGVRPDRGRSFGAPVVGVSICVCILGLCRVWLACYWYGTGNWSERYKRDSRRRVLNLNQTGANG